jgi:hypothetical protein
LRALGLLVVAWATMRTVVLWPGAAVPPPSLQSAAIAATEVPPPRAVYVAPNDAVILTKRTVVRFPVALEVPTSPVKPVAAAFVEIATIQAAPQPDAQVPSHGPEAMIASGSLGLLSSPRTERRWSGTMWALGRGGGAALGSASELGGSQAGVRVFRTLGAGFAATGRVAMDGAGVQEAAAGIGVRSGSVGLLVERRFRLGSTGRNAVAVTAYGGVSEVALPAGLKFDAYGQAGLVGGDGFADGALRVERPVVSAGALQLSVGAGVWGGIQPGVARIDVGPQLVARVPVAGQMARLSAEWRQRVTGNAAPGSGPSVTFGIDF